MARAMRRANRPSPLSVNSSTSCVLVVLVDHVGRGATRGRVHPHVQHGVSAVGEPTLGHVELGRAHPEVEEDAAQAPLARAGSPARSWTSATTRARASNRDWRMIARSPKGASTSVAAATAAGSRSMPEDADAGMGVQERRPQCPPPPEGGVEDQTGGHRGEQPHHLVGHHRLMGKGLAHPQSLDRHDACGWSAATISLEVGGGGCFQRSGRGTAHGPDTFDVHLVPGHGGQARLVGGRSAPAVRPPERRRVWWTRTR